MTERTRNTVNTWLPHIVQILLVLGAIIGFAIAQEHRTTVIEECQKNSVYTLSEATKTISSLQQNQVRILALLEQIESRHQLEDERRIK